MFMIRISLTLKNIKDKECVFVCVCMNVLSHKRYFLTNTPIVT